VISDDRSLATQIKWGDPPLTGTRWRTLRDEVTKNDISVLFAPGGSAWCDVVCSITRSHLGFVPGVRTRSLFYPTLGQAQAAAIRALKKLQRRN
jgi:hypothetical protein